MHLLTLEEWITAVLVKAIGWTFTHSLWQGLLALLLAYTALSLMRKARPAVRYNILILIMVLFISSVIMTFIMTLQSENIVQASTPGNSSLGEFLYRQSNGSIPVIVESKRIVDVMMKHFNQYIELLVAVWFIVFCVKWLRLSLSLN